MHLLNCEVCGESYYSEEFLPDEQLCPDCFIEMYADEEMFSNHLIIKDEEEYDY